MPGRLVLAAVALLAGLVTAAPVAAEDPPVDDGGRRLEARPGALTPGEPWIAYPGDHDGAWAQVWPTQPNLGPISVESCTWDFGDGDIRPGTSDRYPGLCAIGKQWAATGTYTVTLTLRDVEGRDWERTFTVEVRPRPAVRQRIRQGELVAIRTNAPESTVWDLRRTAVHDPTERSTPCRLRRQGAVPRVRCAEPGTWVLVGRDVATGWSLQVDLVVPTPR